VEFPERRLQAERVPQAAVADAFAIFEIPSPALNLTYKVRLMSISGLNHLTMAVSDLDRSVAFYSELLGFSVRMRGPSSAYL